MGAGKQLKRKDYGKKEEEGNFQFINPHKREEVPEHEENIATFCITYHLIGTVY
jgi:hypothetical protein